MSFARARVLRGLQSTFRSTTARVAAPARTQLAVGRRYASGGGHGHAEPSSDIPWLIGGIAVTVPSCYYLWPTASADHGHHDSHDDSRAEEEPAEEKEESADTAPAEEPKEEAAEEKTPKDQQEEGKHPAEPSASGKPSGSQGEGQDAGSTTPSEESTPKEGGGSGVGKGAVKADSDGASEERKSEPDNKGGKKTRIDSGLQKDLGGTPEKFRDEGEENAATSKPTIKGSEGAMTRKQFGLSNTPARHSHQIDESPEKSKKPEGPDTAKVMGTVDPNRPQP